MARIQFLFNSHLPFVRSSPCEEILEERWFFCAMLESYLPMVSVLEKLKKDGIPYQCSWIISPTLTSMAGDELLKKRFYQYVKRLLASVEEEKIRYRNQPEFLKIIRCYEHRFQNSLSTLEKFEGSLLVALKHLSDRGSVELIPSAATSVFFPLYRVYPQIIRGQISCGLANFRDKLGVLNPKSFWLPHCGYYPELEKYLQEQGIQYSFLTPSSLVGKSKVTDPQNYELFQNKDGFVFFPVSRSLTKNIFHPTNGYPTHPIYRDFYCNTAFDVSKDQVNERQYNYGKSIPTGLIYLARTGEIQKKRLYQPQRAYQYVQQHAKDFVSYLISISRKAKTQNNHSPVITCVVELEFFGDWWFEGIDFWDQVFRNLFKSAKQIHCTLPSESLAKVKAKTTLVPSFASLEETGYARIWLNSKNDWLVKDLHLMVEYMTELAQRFDNQTGVHRRFLDQAARQVFLAISSDWPVLLYRSSNVKFTLQEVKRLLLNFYKIADGLSSNVVFKDWFLVLEKKDNLFLGKDFSYKIFTRKELPFVLMKKRFITF